MLCMAVIHCLWFTTELNKSQSRESSESSESSQISNFLRRALRKWQWHAILDRNRTRWRMVDVWLFLIFIVLFDIKSTTSITSWTFFQRRQLLYPHNHNNKSCWKIICKPSIFQLSTSKLAARRMNTIRLPSVLVLVVACLVVQVYGFQTLNGPISPVHKSSSLGMTILTYNGKKKNFKAGSPLSRALPAIGIRPKYSCKK